MADDTSEVHKSYDIHPCDTPRGMLYYNMDVLTDDQQKRLNDLKIQTVREDEQYLANHPEVRACIGLILRQVFKQCPRDNFHKIIAEYFSRSRMDIEADMEEYMRGRAGHVFKGDSNVRVDSSLWSLMSVSVESSPAPSEEEKSPSASFLTESEKYMGSENLEDIIGEDEYADGSLGILKGVLCRTNSSYVKYLIESDILSKVVPEEDEQLEDYIKTQDLDEYAERDNEDETSRDLRGRKFDVESLMEEIDQNIEEIIVEHEPLEQSATPNEQGDENTTVVEKQTLNKEETDDTQETKKDETSELSDTTRLTTITEGDE